MSSADRQVLRRETDGTLAPHADLAPVSSKPWNDIVVDARGNACVNSIGFDFQAANSRRGSAHPCRGSTPPLFFSRAAVRRTAQLVTAPYRLAELDTGNWLPESAPASVVAAVRDQARALTSAGRR